MSLFGFGKSDLPRIKALPPRRSRVISVLDVGSEKISCLIARLRPRIAGEMLPDRSHTIEVLGVGHHRSRGIKAGAVVDIAAAEMAIRQCVDAAERMAGLTVESLIVSLTAGRLKSQRRRADTEVVGEVSAADLSRVTARAARMPLEEGRVALHSTIYDMQLDDDAGLENPVGMTGERLSSNLHVLSAEIAPLRNLEAAINRAQLVVEAFVATPYASALATMVEDEAAMGSACIDMGSGATTIAIFQNGRFVYADQIAVGGSNITMDLARGLSISPADAERIKVMHGSTMAEAPRRHRRADHRHAARRERRRPSDRRQALPVDQDHSSASRRDAGAGARPAECLGPRPRHRQARHPDRRRQPAGRPCRNGPHRPAAERQARATAGCYGTQSIEQGARLFHRRRSLDLSAGCPPRIRRGAIDRLPGS
ncbi:cell division protein FtsA [Jiella pelagia]|uniref:Cell division protein FtsA n=1 Tax=Jiella pelagia TaxID=2986949 RepID=A0ABY7BWC4_9HYPH|nr:cell division protein FtsA [Jiella pelagia]WAP68137.1 cell division protein FtsA [Jiella pelagia]